MQATAIAHPNVALIKYWGKADVATNLPAVGSLSLTLAGIRTRTTVRFSSDLAADTLTINGVADPKAQPRVSRCLDMLRAVAGVKHPAEVKQSMKGVPVTGSVKRTPCLLASITSSLPALR